MQTFDRIGKIVNQTNWTRKFCTLFLFQQLIQRIILKVFKRVIKEFTEKVFLNIIRRMWVLYNGPSLYDSSKINNVVTSEFPKRNIGWYFPVICSSTSSLQTFGPMRLCETSNVYNSAVADEKTFRVNADGPLGPVWI